jgi:hypothetical protein
MKRVRKKKPLYAQQFSLVAVGSSRSGEQIQTDVKLALQEALHDYVDEVATAQPEHGFLAGGLEWLWLFAVLPGAKAAGLGFAGALGKKAGDKLYELFEKRLRKRDLLPKAKAPEPTPAKGKKKHTRRKR